MTYTVTLKHGSFFFSGPIAIAGLGNSVLVDESQLDYESTKAILAAKTSGIIDTDIPEYVQDTFQADISIQDEVTEIVDDVEVAEEVQESDDEVPETTRRGGKKNKRG